MMRIYIVKNVRRKFFENGDLEGEFRQIYKLQIQYEKMLCDLEEVLKENIQHQKEEIKSLLNQIEVLTFRLYSIEERKKSKLNFEDIRSWLNEDFNENLLNN
ncbi:uncharacterized protein LOC111626076 isoform X2 [Centruroides sculpturatus]|uniref:uncharacterized protein LOC111626076 isoform X2 n=1 Tax=Centruroides sculpturatus TaxID=218467 RepID=UPI000C6E2354|nr:uncharacterized protein LOC111626076 isoform X2 [Centruroides sculpturatus]